MEKYSQFRDRGQFHLVLLFEKHSTYTDTISRLWNRALLPRLVAFRRHLPSSPHLSLLLQAPILHHNRRNLLHIPAMVSTRVARQEGYLMDDTGDTRHMVD